MNVAAVLMEILKSSGIRYLFGNPGTTELPFLDALPDSSLEYVLGLPEATAVAAADGYAQASGQAGVVNVHVAPGLANSLSILHNAARAKSPLVVTAGQQDTRVLMHEPILAGESDMVTGFKQGHYDKAFVSSIYNRLSRTLFHVPVKDLNSVKAYRREIMDALPIRPDWHRYMIVIAAAEGFTVTEIPVPLYPRHAGKSKFATWH